MSQSFTPTTEAEKIMYAALQRIAQNTNSSVDWNESRQAIAQRTLQALTASSQPAQEAGMRYSARQANPIDWQVWDDATDMPASCNGKYAFTEHEALAAAASLNADSGNGGQG